ncbi:MAG: PP2C family protein-serine/threonine phosphatase [bacterium]|nr:PP2C family protein-serine/threonine phosphatase [bacterium]
MHKRLYRTVEALLGTIDDSAGGEAMLRDVLHLLVDNPAAEQLGITSGRLYRERKHDYDLIESVGGLGAALAGKTISKDYQVVRDIERRRLWVISPSSPGFDPAVESQFGDTDSAAILVGRDPNYILSLSIRHHGSEEDLLVLLETIRAAVGLKLRMQILASQMRQARSIQHSLLPGCLPVLPGFEIAAISLPADEVGGDVYDVQDVEPGTIGFLLADASGHGLPAALQARDVVVGMRMGQARGEKINATVARLNRVINQGGLASRFISLFYGELETTGGLVYVNGGHPPPLLATADGDVRELMTCGPVLGPLPDAAYRRGYVALEPGDALLVYSDGVTERLDPQGPGGEDELHEFGRERLAGLVAARRAEPAADIAEAVIAAVRAFGRDAPLADDVSVVVIRRLPAAAYPPAGGLASVSAGTSR